MLTKIAEPCNCLSCKERCTFFYRLEDHEFEQLNGLKKAVRYRKGEMIQKKGTNPPYLLLISSGYVKVMIEADHEKRFILELLGPHNLVASNIFNGNVSAYTITAITDVVICHLNVQPFINIMENNGRFSTDILKYMNEHGSARFRRLRSVTLKQSRGKVADVILYIASLNGGNDIFKHLSRKDLAEMANISMENAIRTLREFADENLIVMEKKDIRINDSEALRRISQIG